MTLHRSQLYPYQQRAAEFIKANPNCALWIDCGLGKTVATQTAYLDLLNSFDANHGLVIAPLRVARKVWTDEVQEWSHLQDLDIVHIGGAEKQRQKAIRTRADLHTIGRENTQWLINQFIEGKKQVRKWPWDTVILDESQSFKSQSSFRWKALRLVRKLFPRCVELTGTPAPKGYGDLWSQIYLLDRGQRLGTSESAYRLRWFDVENCGDYSRYHLKGHAAKEIQAALSDIVISLRAEDYFDLPPVVYNPVRVALTEVELAKYRKFARTSVFERASGQKITAANAGALYGKLLQLANGAIYHNDKGEYEEFHHAKIDGLLEMLEGITGPCIVAYAFRSDTKRIAAALDRYCGKTKSWRVMDTDDNLNAFSRGEIDIAVMHPASAGHGLNDLHKSGSQDVVWFGLTPNLEYYQQLNNRLAGGIRRLGKNVKVHHLLAENTEDEDCYELLKGKAKSQDELTNAMTEKVKHGRVSNV